jgi:hypothetical protein
MAAPLQFDLPGFTTEGQKFFLKRSQELINSLNQRLKKKGFKGRLPLADGRAALAKGVGKPCRYCREIIKISTMSPDHPTPLVRGGEPWDIECIDVGCNREKGELTAEEYVRFRAHVLTYTPEAQEYIHRMMKAGGAFFKMRARMDGMAARERKEKAATAPAE